MVKDDFKVGQIVYLETEDGTIETPVTKVGRRYIEVQQYSHIIKFDITDNFREVTKYSPSYRLYLTKQEILDKNEKSELFVKIRISFEWYSKKNYSLETLRKINEILEQEETE